MIDAVGGLRFYPAEFEAEIEYYPDITRIDVRANEHEAGFLSIGLFGWPILPDDNTGYGAEFDLTPADARRFATLLIEQAAAIDGYRPPILVRNLINIDLGTWLANGRIETENEAREAREDYLPSYRTKYAALLDGTVKQALGELITTLEQQADTILGAEQ